MLTQLPLFTFYKFRINLFNKTFGNLSSKLPLRIGLFYLILEYFISQYLSASEAFTLNALWQRSRFTEIADLYLVVFVDENIFWFEVTMDYI